MSEYVMGQSGRERRRLALQAEILNPLTAEFFHRAGLRAGMNVLEFGCGVGDVSLLAARFVGPTGHVTSLDLDERSLETARARAASEGFHWIDFRKCDLTQYTADQTFDAVVGRYVLVHAKDPRAMVRTAFDALHSGGVAVFHEADFSIHHPSYPDLPMTRAVLERVREFMIKAVPANIGSQLCHLMLEAGFSKPCCRGVLAIDSGPDSKFYEWFAETVRTLLPPMLAMGIVRPGEIEIDSLASRIREEATSKQASIAAPILIECFARKP